VSQPLGFSTPKTLSYVAANIVTALEALGLLPMEHLEPGRELQPGITSMF
jgi:hypothetical protein